MKEDNPPAFPLQAQGDHKHRSGMSLRDYFAGQALVAELSCATSERCVDALVTAAVAAGQTPEQRIAFNCYRMADAMLAARQPGEGAA